MFIYPYGPFVPTYRIPPTVYSILNAMANFDVEKEEQTKIKDLASVTHSKIFDFDYPLSQHINKDDFEIMILNKFLMRRIGFDTVNAFKIQLNVRLNEILPMYNMLFDALNGWNLFETGGITKRILDDNTTSQNDTTSTQTNESTSNLESNSTTNSNSTTDSRRSDTPQNNINDVKAGHYVSEYQYDENNANSTDNSTSNGTNTSDSNLTQNVTGNTTQKLSETIEQTPANKIEIYRQFIEQRNSIYNMIFNDLEDLFYGLV